MNGSTKVTFAGVGGFDAADTLQKHNTIVEKATAHTVLMLATMQLRPGAADRALHALSPLADASLSASGTRETPLDWLSARPLLEAHAVRRGMPVRRVGIGQAAGRIAAETIELFPPGIPVIAPGWPIHDASLDALQHARAVGGRVVASDPSLETIAVVAGTRAS